MQKVVQLRPSILFIMRCSFIILAIQLTFTGILLAGNAKGQNLDKVKVDLNLDHASLQESLLTLQRKSGIRISFFDEMINRESRKVTLNGTRISAADALKKILANTGLNYRLVKDYVVIDAKPIPQEPGKIYGKITDDKGESLPGASVKIIELNKVISTAVDGSYSFSAAAGTYTLEISYVSYQTKRIADVLVKTGALTKLDIVLNVSSNALKTVTIQSSFKKEAVAGLYAQQKNAAGITDGISAEQIARTPDNNIGQVLKRISGINMIDNRYLVVRGLTDRYNQGMIDGIVLPSTDMNFRNFSFDVLPVEMVSNVVVNKTATPDISAEFAGGQVSVNTLDIPLENFTSIGIGAGFNSNTLGKTFTQAGKRGKYDFLGFDDGHRKMPSGIQSWGGGPIPDYALAQSKLLNSDAFRLYNSTGGLNQNYRFSAGRVYKLKNDQQWGFVAALSLRNTQETSNFLNARGFEVFQNYPKYPMAFIDSTKYVRDGHHYKYNTTAGAVFNAGIQGKNYKLGLKNIFSQIFNNILSTETGGNPDDLSPTQRAKRTLQNPEITRVIQSKLEGEYNLTNSGLKLTWTGAVTKVSQETKDQTKFTYYLTGSDNGVDYFQSPNVTTPAVNAPKYDYRLFADANETDYNWAGNLSQPFNFLGDKSIVKAGYNGTYKRRSLDLTKLKVLTEDRNFNGFDKPYEEIMKPENMGIGTNGNQAYYFADGNNGQQFDGKSRFHAGYLMLDQRFLNKLRFVYGMRIEKYDLNNRQLDDKTIVKPTGEKNTVYLPSVNFTYNINPKMNFRASFTKTIIRPDFRETSYFGAYDYQRDAYIRGANLQSTKVKNTDIRWEWYPSAGELLSISGFYKSFDKPIELIVGQDGFQTTEYRFQNQKDAVNYGAELEIRKSLGFIAENQWLRNLTIFANGTVMKSKIHTLTYIDIPADTIENKETRPLYGQSPFIINAGIGYATANYGLTLSYNRTGYRTFTVSANPNRTEYENGRDVMDLQLFCRLLKQKMEIKLNVGNLLNSTSSYYVNGNGYVQSDDTSGDFQYLPFIGKDKYEKEFDDVRYRIKYGVTSSLVISYKF